MASVTNIVWLDVANGIQTTISNTPGTDTVSTGGIWTFTESVIISGDLTVNGTTTTINTQDVLIADRFVIQSYNYQTAAARNAGVVFVVDPEATTYTILNADATLPNLGSAGFVMTADPALLSVGDIISVTGATAAPENNGLYEVTDIDHVNFEVEIDGTGTPIDGSVAGIVNTGVTDETFAGTMVQALITVIRANDGTEGTGGLGTMAIGYGNATALTFEGIVTAPTGVVDLQEAYDNGPTIVTDATGSIAFSGTQSFTADMDVQVSLDAGQASATALVLTASNAAGGIDINSGTAGVDLDTTGSVNLDSSQAAATAIVINASNAAGGIDIDSGTGGIAADSTGAISLDSTALVSNFTLTANSGSDALLTLKASNAGAGNGNILIEADNIITVQTLASTINIATNAVAQTINVGTGAAAMTVNVGSNNTTSTTTIESGSGGINMDGDGNSTWDLDGDLTWTLYECVVTQDETQAAGGEGNDFTWTAGVGGAASGGGVPGGDGGDIFFDGGTGGAATGADSAGTGGSLGFQSGTGGAASGGGGDAGAGGGAIWEGGDGGNASGADAAGQGGVARIAGGKGGNGTASAAAGAGGTAQILGGDAGTAVGTGGNGGNVTINGGNASGAGVDGGIAIGGSNTSYIDLGSTTLPSFIRMRISGTQPIQMTSAGADTAEVLRLTTTGAGGDLIEWYVGNSNPNTRITPPVGSLYSDGTGGALYVNTDGTNTGWVDLLSGSISLQEAYNVGNTILTVNTSGGPVAITTTADETDAGLTVTGGAHTGGTAQNLVVLTHDDQATGDALSITNPSTGIGIDIDATGAATTAPQIQVGFGSTAFTGTPVGINLDYETANFTNTSGEVSALIVDIASTTVAGNDDIKGIFLNGAVHGGTAATIGIDIATWDWGFKTSSPTNHDADVYAYFGSDTSDGVIGFASASDQFAYVAGLAAAANDTNGNKVYIASQEGGAAAAAPGGTGGEIKLDVKNGGAAANNLAAGTGGLWDITAGDGGAASTGTGTAGTGGSGTLEAGRGGDASTSNPGGVGGALTITAGQGGDSDDGTGPEVAGDGGDLTLNAGGPGVNLGGGAGTAGDITIGTTNAYDISIGNSVGTHQLFLNSGTLPITCETGADYTGAVLTMENTTQANPQGIYIGLANPAFNANPGSIYLQDNGNSSAVWVNTSAATPGNTWTQLGSAAGNSLQQAYDQGNTIVTDASGPISFTLSADAQGFSVQGSSSGNGIVSIGGTTAVDSIDMDATGASSFTVTGASADLTLSSVGGSVNISGTEADAAAVSIQATSGGIDIDAGTNGIDITSTGAIAVTGPDNNATSIVFDAGGNTFLTFDSTDNVEQLELGQFFDVGSDIGLGDTYTAAAGNNFTKGHLAVLSSGALTLELSDANNTSRRESQAVGVAMETVNAGNSGRFHTAYGVPVRVKFDTSHTAPSIGSMAYVDITSGVATLDTSGHGSGDYIVEVGMVMSATDGSTNAIVMWAPRFVSAIA